MFNAIELTGMQETQEDHMMDECVIRTYSGVRDSYGQIISSYIDGVTTKCGLYMTGGEIMDKTNKTTIQYDATLRLPLAVTITLRDRIKITKRFGTTVTAQEYDIVSPLLVGPSGIRVYLREVTA